MPGQSSIRFALAGASHDAGLRQLLREAKMPGRIAVSLEREPSVFAAADLDAPEYHTVVGIDNSDEIACAGTVSIRLRYLNGRPERVGYLAQLRLAPRYAGRFDILRRGYQFFRGLHDQLDVAAYFTTVASDNARAARLLERGIPGLPIYRPLGDLVTVLLPVRRLSRPVRRQLRKEGLSIRHGIGPNLDGLVSVLADHNSKYQLSPAWSPEDITTAFARFNLSDNGFRLIAFRDHLVAAAAMWDQRPFKQAVIIRYPAFLSFLRPFYNAAAPLLRLCPLPAPARPIPQAFISFLASTPETFLPLLQLLTASARTAGVGYFILTLDARDPRLAILTRSFPCRTYHTRLYSVAWPDAPPVHAPDDRLLYPEAALL